MVAIGTHCRPLRHALGKSYRRFPVPRFIAFGAPGEIRTHDFCLRRRCLNESTFYRSRRCWEQLYARNWPNIAIELLLFRLMSRLFGVNAWGPGAPAGVSYN